MSSHMQGVLFQYLNGILCLWQSPVYQKVTNSLKKMTISPKKFVYVLKLVYFCIIKQKGNVRIQNSG